MALPAAPAPADVEAAVVPARDDCWANWDANWAAAARWPGVIAACGGTKLGVRTAAGARGAGVLPATVGTAVVTNGGVRSPTSADSGDAGAAGAEPRNPVYGGAMKRWAGGCEISHIGTIGGMRSGAGGIAFS